MFKNKNDNNIIYKCTVQLLEDADILECEFQVILSEILFNLVKN